MNAPSVPDLRLARHHRSSPIVGVQATGCLIVALAILLPGVVYFGLFGLILLDEFVLDTYFVSNYVPEPGLEFLRTIYAPLLYLIALA